MVVECSGLNLYINSQSGEAFHCLQFVMMYAFHEFLGDYITEDLALFREYHKKDLLAKITYIECMHAYVQVCIIIIMYNSSFCLILRVDETVNNQFSN